MTIDSIALTQDLVRFPSLNPPGEEEACIDHLARLLAGGGFEVEAHPFAPGRPSLVARRHGRGPDKPLCFAGHVDVVPLGAEAWSVLPFGGEIRDGKLFGRGASDMKAGVAAFVAASLNACEGDAPLRRGITLVITAGEETGCQGAFHLGELGVLGPAALLVVAEPSSNGLIIAHKGSLRLSVSATGRTAHSSMPHLGDNAIDRAAAWIQSLSSHRFGGSDHHLLGSVTAAVTTIAGGLNINSVPDSASFTVDLRTLPDRPHSEILAEVRALFGPQAMIATLTDFPGFATDPEDAALAPLLDILTERNGERPVPAGAPYFTDASALVPALDGVATVVIGPGELAQCHRTDEFCFTARIVEATEIYGALIDRLCV